MRCCILGLLVLACQSAHRPLALPPQATQIRNESLPSNYLFLPVSALLKVKLSAAEVVLATFWAWAASDRDRNSDHIGKQVLHKHEDLCRRLPTLLLLVQ